MDNRQKQASRLLSRSCELTRSQEKGGKSIAENALQHSNGRAIMSNMSARDVEAMQTSSFLEAGKTASDKNVPQRLPAAGTAMTAGPAKAKEFTTVPLSVDFHSDLPGHPKVPDYGAYASGVASATSSAQPVPAGGDAISYVIDKDGAVITMDRTSLESGSAKDGRGRGGQPATAHCHITPKDTGVDKKARFKLILASFLCMIFMIGECVGGVLAHSLAVVSDAAHLLTDFASFMISLMALYLASRPATKRLSFGWHRAEILGALVSILMLWVITGILAYSAVLRIQSGDYEIDATIMLITSSVGVVFNVVLGCTLHQHGHGHGGSHGHSHGGGGHSHGDGHGHSYDHESGHHNPRPAHTDSHTPSSPQPSFTGEESSPRDPLIDHPHSSSVHGPRPRGYGSMSVEAPVPVKHSTQAKKKKKGKKNSNINVKAAFIHVLGDFCQSVGVLVAAFIIYFKPEWKIADPICTFLFSVLVLITTINILRDILVVLMEGTPRDINFEEVRDTILNMEGVKDLHDLRVWSLTMDKTALSVHLAVERGVDPMQVVQTASKLIQSKYNIKQTTMQVEEFVDEMHDCTQCQDLKD